MGAVLDEQWQTLRALLGTADELPDEDVDAILDSARQMAEQLAEEREVRARLQARLTDEQDAYDSAPVLFCSVEPASLRLLQCNRTMLRRLGRPAEAVLGRSLADFVPVEERAPLGESLGHIARGEPALERDFHVGTDQRYLVVRVAGNAERDADGRALRLRLVLSDATQERRLEAQLVHAQRMEAIGRLAGGVAHDFNNLLSVITACASFLTPSVVGGSHEQDVHDILHAARRGADLTHHLLAFSRQQVVQVEAVDLNRMVSRLHVLLRRILDDHVRIELDLGEDLDAVRIDAAKFEQVLLNMVINAQDAMPGGGRLLLRTDRVDVDAAAARTMPPLAPGVHARLSVVDTGTGMSPEIQARIFEPFFTTKKRGRGTGLGLSMCYGIVRQLGGAIGVHSVLGEGSRFDVYLPVLERTRRAAPPGGEGPQGRGQTVLLVEDDASVRRVTARILREAKYRVVEATDGQDALELASAYLDELAAVVTDVVMPRLGGRELVVQLRHHRPDVAVLYTSGYGGPIGPGSLGGAERHLPKPFTPVQLQSALHEALRDVKRA